jgi:NAD(P)-dependent dehydrogenase (short-subunit alcohol dehydrogenase family)
VGFNLQGKVALVTGAGGLRGIGRATALRMARDGADVALLDRRWPRDERPIDEQDGWEGVESVAREIEALGRRAAPIYADVSVEEQVQAAVATTLQRLGRIDFLVANAGSRPGADRQNIVDVPEEAFRHVLDVNLVGSFLCCKAVGRHFVERNDGGAVVIVSSEVGRAARARLAAYSASKFALVGLAQSFALEMAPYQVRVNAICPGAIDNARLDWTARAIAKENETPEARRAQFIADSARATPLGRAGTSEEVANVIAFLCSSESAYMTGQTVGVDGGSRM